LRKGPADTARHVIHHTSRPHLSSQSASYDVASELYQKRYTACHQYAP
jgi:hypothetical protein